MPLIYVEPKRSGVPVFQACNQIEKYAHEGVFSGLFSLVQIFVAMEPAETVYFANPGEGGDFSLCRFHWASSRSTSTATSPETRPQFRPRRTRTCCAFASRAMIRLTR